MKSVRVRVGSDDVSITPRAGNQFCCNVRTPRVKTPVTVLLSADVDSNASTLLNLMRRQGFVFRSPNAAGFSRLHDSAGVKPRNHRTASANVSAVTALIEHLVATSVIPKTRAAPALKWLASLSDYLALNPPKPLLLGGSSARLFPGGSRSSGTRGSSSGHAWTNG